MLFHGELELSNDPASRLSVSLTIESETLSLATGTEKLGTWNRTDAKAIEISRGKYDLTLGDETLVFTPENAPMFASRGLPFFNRTDPAEEPAGFLAKIKKWGLKPTDFAQGAKPGPDGDGSADPTGPFDAVLDKAPAQAGPIDYTERAAALDRARSTSDEVLVTPPGPVTTPVTPTAPTRPDPAPETRLMGSRPGPTSAGAPIDVFSSSPDPDPDPQVNAVQPTEPVVPTAPAPVIVDAPADPTGPNRLLGPPEGSLPSTPGPAPVARPVIPIEMTPAVSDSVVNDPVVTEAGPGSSWEPPKGGPTKRPQERPENPPIRPKASKTRKEGASSGWRELAGDNPFDDLPGLPDLPGLLQRLEVAVKDLQDGRMEPARGRAIADVVRAMCRAVEVSGYGAKGLNSMADKLDGGNGLDGDAIEDYT